MRRPRRPAEETREEILNTAERMFRAQGYASVSIADIATELSMSPANVFKHFRTKTSLVDAIATRAIEQTLNALKALASDKPAPERLYALAQHLMDEHLSEQVDAPFVFEMILVTITEELDCGDRFRQIVVGMIGEIIAAGVEEGVYHADDIPRLANATFVFALPGSTSACRTAWETIISAQLDARTKPCNLANLRPRLKE